MPHSLVLEVPESDRDYFEKLAREGHDVTIVEADKFEGAAHIVEVIVTLSPVLVPICVAYLSRPSSSKESRKAVIDGQRRTFENYSADELTRILESQQTTRKPRQQ